MASIPTQRTIKQLKEDGYVYQVVERWNPFAKRRVDLFGIVDILAMREGVGIIGIQTTSSTHHSKRRDKAIAEPRLRTWLQCGGRFQLWSWGKRGPRGKRKVWTLKREELKVDDITTA